HSPVIHGATTALDGKIRVRSVTAVIPGRRGEVELPVGGGLSVAFHGLSPFRGLGCTSRIDPREDGLFRDGFQSPSSTNPAQALGDERSGRLSRESCAARNAAAGPCRFPSSSR